MPTFIWPVTSKQPLATRKLSGSHGRPTCAYARVCLLNYDYLITDAKLEKDDNVADIANPNTESVVDAPADANVLSFRLVYE